MWQPYSDCAKVTHIRSRGIRGFFCFIPKTIIKLTGRVIFKGDPGYEAARKNWDPHTDRFPKVFVFAQKTQDVANAIRWARKNNVPIRPRSGRHALETNLSQVKHRL